MSQLIRTPFQIRMEFAGLVAQLMANGANKEEVRQILEFAFHFEREEVQAILGLTDIALAAIRSMIPVFAQNAQLKRENEARDREILTLRDQMSELSKSTPAQRRQAPLTNGVSLFKTTDEQPTKTFASTVKQQWPLPSKDSTFTQELPASDSLAKSQEVDADGFRLPPKKFEEEYDDLEVLGHFIKWLGRMSVTFTGSSAAKCDICGVNHIQKKKMDSRPSTLHILHLLDM